MVIADPCEYCVLFITTSNGVCSAPPVPTGVRTGISSSMKVILGFWELIFPPWWFQLCPPCLLLGLEVAVCCDLSCHPSGRPLALTQQSKECRSKDTLQLLLGPWSSAGTGTSEGEVTVSAGILAPTVLTRHFIGKNWGTVLEKSHCWEEGWFRKVYDGIARWGSSFSFLDLELGSLSLPLPLLCISGQTSLLSEAFLTMGLLWYLAHCEGLGTLHIF